MYHVNPPTTNRAVEKFQPKTVGMWRKEQQHHLKTYESNSSGVTTGPQPIKIEESLGEKVANESVIMVDTYKPLNLTSHSKIVDDKEKPLSWLK